MKSIVAFCSILLAFGGTLTGTLQKSENVILFTLDGLRWQEVFAGADPALMNKEAGGVDDVEALRQEFWADDVDERRRLLLPFFWDVLVPSGQLFGNAWGGSEVHVTNGHNFSYPGYNELLSGFPDNRIDSNDKIFNQNPNVLEWLAGKPGFNGRVAAFTSWDVFPFILNEPRAGIMVNSGWEPLEDLPLTPRQELINQLMSSSLHEAEGVRSDELTFFAALEYLQKARPRVLFISLDGTDTNAHSGRYDNYLRSAHISDQYLKLLWEQLQSMDGYAGKTTLLITTDHGRGGAGEGWRGHGADVDESKLMWIGAIGPNIVPLGERTNAATLTQSQIAATIAELLGFDYQAEVHDASGAIEQIAETSSGPLTSGCRASHRESERKSENSVVCRSSWSAQE
ncbi:MAG TPA: AP protein [Acidobacteriota bacterium]|nr:AP protein [Acidobacteriota bacterium]HJO29336.1 AP protein [Acidobacteriota bacterium]